MAVDIQLAAARFESFARDVLAPVVCTDAHALEAEVFQCAEPVGLAAAARGEYKRVKVGWEWGPVWSTAWFRVRGRVPKHLAGRCVALRFSSGTEALVWRDGAPWHGLDRNRDTISLFESAAGDEPVEFLIEAACTHALGQLGTQWDPPEFLKHWQEARPGKLERCELAAHDARAWRLHRAYVFALQLMRELPADSARAQELCAALEQATGLVDAANVGGTAATALSVIKAALAQPAGAGAVLCHAVGHAHIDTAWLWPVRETRRKCLRTFATALRNLERFPGFVFLCSQAQQYAWVEETAPALFAQIREHIAKGRWEAGGAMWIEPDCNLVSGESLVRQIVHGTRYWRAKFGEKGEQRYLYLPDTFGFAGALPQIMKLAGLETFITHKLSWNDTNPFPHTNFRWRGIDGTEVLAHCMPGHDYNLLMSPRELRRGEANHTGKAVGAPARYLQPFGYGDGGGGPTDWQILHAELAADCAGVPRVGFSRVDEFCAALARDREVLRRAGAEYPVWDGELYLEAHRGTYTTQAWIKRANRRAEEGLRLAEMVVWGAPAAPPAGEARRLRAEQDAAWKLMLLNQFHDILPGSSIAWVYRDAQADYAKVRETVAGHVAGALRALGEQLETTGTREPVSVFNPTSAEQSAVIEVRGRPVYAERIPALGVRMVDAGVDAVPASGPVRIEDQFTLDNGVVRCVIEKGGTISSLRRAGVDADLCAPPPGRGLNELMLYDDRPKNWDAWDIDAGYEQNGARLIATRVSAKAEGPLRARIEVRYEATERASIVQEYVLEAGSPRVDVRTIVDWNESHRLLRALFPTTINARHATYETAFGFIQRSTGRATSHERAAFEVPAHRWMDLSDEAGARGLALLNDCKYGHSCHDGVMGLSLLRAPTFPDEAADRGVHRFTYSLMPHAGDWRAAGVDDQAELLNAPLLAEALRPGRAGALGKEWAPLRITCEGGARATVTALKVAEEDERVILRLVETRGRSGTAVVRWGMGVRGVETVDLHERSMSQRGVSHDAATGSTLVNLQPFQIVTLAAHRT